MLFTMCQILSSNIIRLQRWGNAVKTTLLALQRVIVLFPGYQPSPYWSPCWICTQHPTCQWSSTSICCHSKWFLVTQSYLGSSNPYIYMITWSYLILRVIPAIHETNALREVLWQRVGKFLLKSTPPVEHQYSMKKHFMRGADKPWKPGMVALRCYITPMPK